MKVERPQPDLEHRPHRDAGAREPAAAGDRDDRVGRRTGRKAAARMRARISRSATMAELDEAQPVLGGRRRRDAPRLPTRAPEHPDERRRDRRAESENLLHGRVPAATRFARQSEQGACTRAAPAPASPRTFRIYRFDPDSGENPARRQLRDRHGQLRADGSRRADQDQERDRSDAVVPPVLPRGHLRLLRDEHRRREHAGLHARLRRTSSRAR